MKRNSSWLLVLFLVSAGGVSAQSPTELFQRAKDQVKSGAWSEALGTLATLETEVSKAGNEAASKQLEGPLAFYRGVCEANLGKTPEAVRDFGAFLSIQPNATIDAAVYSKKAVAAFEEARKIASTSAKSLAEAYQRFRPPHDSHERNSVDQYWADGPVRWILTADEKSAWASLGDPNGRVDFVERFWVARSKRSGLDGRTYREEFERRVAFADDQFVQDVEQRGSMTDRGMVFILLGAPTYAGRKPLRTGDDSNDNAGLSTVGSFDGKMAEQQAKKGGPVSSGQLAKLSSQYVGPGTKAPEAAQNGIEVWHYRKELLPPGVPYQQVDMEFQTKKGYGVNVLRRESDCVTTLEAARKQAAPTGSP